MGRSIGSRIIDEFLSKSGVQSCSNFRWTSCRTWVLSSASLTFRLHKLCRDTSDVIAKVAFKMFLGINAEVTAWNAENTIFSLVFSENPFVDFVELPPQYVELQVWVRAHSSFNQPHLHLIQEMFYLFNSDEEILHRIAVFHSIISVLFSAIWSTYWCPGNGANECRVRICSRRLERRRYQRAESGAQRDGEERYVWRV